MFYIVYYILLLVTWAIISHKHTNKQRTYLLPNHNPKQRKNFGTDMSDT